MSVYHHNQIDVLCGWAMGPYGRDGFWFSTIRGNDVQVPVGFLSCNYGLAQEGYDFVIDTEDQRHVYNRIMDRLRLPSDQRHR